MVWSCGTQTGPVNGMIEPSRSRRRKGVEASISGLLRRQRGRSTS